MTRAESGLSFTERESKGSCFGYVFRSVGGSALVSLWSRFGSANATANGFAQPNRVYKERYVLVMFLASQILRKNNIL